MTTTEQHEIEVPIAQLLELPVITVQCKLCGQLVSGRKGQELDRLCAIHYAAEHCG